jgi:hypothetical protein
MNEELIHVHFEEFLVKNPFYADALDHEKEMYYALFKAGYEVGNQIGYDEGYDLGYDGALYNIDAFDRPY